MAVEPGAVTHTEIAAIGRGPPWTSRGATAPGFQTGATTNRNGGNPGRWGALGQVSRPGPDRAGRWQPGKCCQRRPILRTLCCFPLRWSFASHRPVRSASGACASGVPGSAYCGGNTTKGATAAQAGGTSMVIVAGGGRSPHHLDLDPPPTVRHIRASSAGLGWSQISAYLAAASE